MIKKQERKMVRILKEKRETNRKAEYWQEVPQMLDFEEELKKFYKEKEEKYSYFKIKQSDVTLEEWIKVWVKDYKRLTIAESTLEGYISKINSYIRPYFKERKIQEIDKNDIQLLVNYMGTLKKKKTRDDKERK